MQRSDNLKKKRKKLIIIKAFNRLSVKLAKKLAKKKIEGDQ